jgi:hypothetical protein
MSDPLADWTHGRYDGTQVVASWDNSNPGSAQQKPVAQSRFLPHICMCYVSWVWLVRMLNSYFGCEHGFVVDCCVSLYCIVGLHEHARDADLVLQISFDAVPHFTLPAKRSMSHPRRSTKIAPGSTSNARPSGRLWNVWSHHEIFEASDQLTCILMCGSWIDLTTYIQHTSVCCMYVVRSIQLTS